MKTYARMKELDPVGGAHVGGAPGSANGIVAASLIGVDPGFPIGEDPNPRWGGADLRHRRILAKMYVNINERMGSDLPQF